MATAAKLAFAARRNEARTWTMRFVGVDWSASTFRAQVRQYRDQPGPALITLAQVADATAEGLYVVGVTTEAGVPVTTVTGRISKATMSDATKVPYTGELGADAKLAWAVQVDGVTRIIGAWWALAAVMDSDDAVGSTEDGFSASDCAPGQWSAASLTIASDEVIELRVDGAEVLSALAVAAKESESAATIAMAQAKVSAAAAAAAVLTAPGVYTSIAAGRDAVAVGATFWAPGAGGVSLYRKTLTGATKVATLGGNPFAALSLTAAADAKIVEFAATIAGSAVLTARTDIFDASDLGKTIVVAGAGNGGGKLVTTIASVDSATAITLATAASTTTSTAGASVGTDAGPALKAALTALNAAGGGTLIIDGLYLIASPVSVTFGSNAAQICIEGRGGDSGLIVAVGATDDAIVLSGGGRWVIDGLNCIGTPLEPCDAHRTLSLLSTFAVVRNCGFFGIGAIANSDTGAVIYAENTDLAMYDNFFGGCSTGLSQPVVMNKSFAGFHSERDRFFDYGRFLSIYFSKTGLSFSKAWIYGENQFGEDQGAATESVFRVTDSRFDEGHIFAVAVTTDLGSGKRISRVNFSGLQINETFSNPGCALYVERADHVIIEQTSLGWCNVPHAGLTLNDCGVVLVDGVKISAGATGAPTGTADEIVATDVTSLIVKDSDFARFTFTRVASFSQVEGGVGAVLPFYKSGRVTDADFTVPPPVGTIAADVFSGKIYLKATAGWLATPALTASADPLFALNNVTRTTSTQTGANTFAKTSGADGWGTSVANLIQAQTGSFKLQVTFPIVGHYVRVGVQPASTGSDYLTTNNDLDLGILLNNDGTLFLASEGNLVSLGKTYTASQTVELDYNASTNIVTTYLNGTQIDQRENPSTNLSPSHAYRFAGTIYDVGGGFTLVDFSAG